MPSSYPPVPVETGFTFAKRHRDTYAEIDPATQSDCTGKAVLVTGASRGIGLATALSYAAAGTSHLALAARSEAALAQAKADVEAHCQKLGKPSPSVLITIVLDVTDEASVNAAAEQVRTAFGRLDILINNAGRIDRYVPIADSDPALWWEQHRVNVLGPYLCTRAFLPLLLGSNGDKTIVNTSSIGAHAILAGGSAYAMAKLGVLRFCEYVMHEYAEQGVLCYGVHPGGVVTDMASYMTEEFVETLLTDEVSLPADALVWLTQTRREWLAGRYVDLTWDMPEFVSREEEIVNGDKLKVRLIV